MDGLKSKWYIWECLIKEISISMEYIHTYLRKTRSEFQRQIGEFGHYCPVCLALQNHLVDCSETASLMYAAEYNRRYFKMCSTQHLESFLASPDQFVSPLCPRPLPEADLLPKKLTEAEVRNRFPQQIEMKGFCPVTYLDGKERYEALVHGSMEFAVEYRERLYTCETKQKQYKFLSAPEVYWDLKLPSKVPPLCEPIPLTSLPTLGYLEQVRNTPNSQMNCSISAHGCQSKLFFFLPTAFNHSSTEHIRQMYKKKLASFEENCALIPYLSSLMRADYKLPSELPVDFDFKMKKFLALRDSPKAKSANLA
uniref:Cilia- and flagella-associated protein 206 n=1 Tax=Hippocampus comes TaxID=109280 RepID=A0A3Q2YX64_HIPCM